MKIQTRYVKLLHSLLFLFLFTGAGDLFGQGVVQTVSTFQSVSIYWSGSGGSANTVCNVKYRAVGASTWLNGYPLWFDTRVHNANDIAGYQGVVLPANQYRGSIVGLNAGTNYEIQLTAGANTATTTTTTWAETSAWPVSNITAVTNSSTSLSITTSGTASGYRLYTGNATIDVANGAANCIYINAAYVIVRGLTLKGASEDAIRLGPQAHDIVIENCDISGWGATTFASAYSSFPNTHSAVRIRGKAENDATSTENCYGVTRIVVQRNKIHDPRGTAGSWDNGYPYGPQGVCFQEAGGNNVIRYNDIYGSDTKHFQDGIGGLNNFTKSGFPRENTDIYGNKVSYCYDDGIEVEGADCNSRIYGNFLDNTFTGISTATNSVGPLYVFRNVTYVSRRHGAGATNASLDIEDRGPFNKCGTQNNGAIGGRTFLFHNTVLQPTQPGFANTRGLNGGVMDNGGGPVQNTFSRNNIWTAAYQGQGGRSVAENYNGSGVGCTYQYDVCNTSLVLLTGVASNIISGNPVYAAGVPVAPLAINGGPRTQGYELATNSLGYNAGTILPNFNDGFNGAAPDAGAYEAGKPVLEFGINAYLPGGNNPPVANAGQDITITLPTTSATLTGSATDADGTIASYTWTRVSGPGTYALGTANAATTTVTGLSQGTHVFRLTVTDNGGASGSDDVIVTVNAATNLPPTANAGSDITMTLPANSTTLLGSGSDADGTIASYAWSKISGPAGGTLGSPNAATTTVTALGAGVYVFRLTVTDNNGATGTDSVIVTVNAALNQPPAANAGADITITLPVNSTTLNGNGTDADGTIAGYAWTKVSGPAGGTLGSPNAATTPVTALNVVGVYVFKLTVTDNAGATGTDTVRVTVNAAPNIPPTANAGSDITITLPTNSTTLVGSGTDADGTIASYAWTKVGGPAGGTLGSSNAATTTVTALNVAGVYVFKLTVTDNAGATGTDTVRVTVNPAANIPPTANAGNNITITLPANSTTLVGSGTDADGTITSYAWTKVSGPAGGTLGSPNAATTTVTALGAGIYVFRLTVTDNNGATAFDDITVTVNLAPNEPPTANAGNNISITLPANSTTLNGSGSDPDGTITNYTWTYVSGPNIPSFGSPNAATTTVSGLIQGVYVFRLTVTDNNGATATDDVTVTVNASVSTNQPPVANAGNNVTLNMPANSATLNGTASFDPDGTIASYQWTLVSGPGNPSVGTANGSTTTVTGLSAAGTYVFQLRVTDNDGATDDDNVTIVVSAIANTPPMANAGNNITITLPLNSTNLNGEGSNDPDGLIVTYAWTKISGGPCTIANASAAATGVSGLAAGTYVFRLTVTDNDGSSSTDDVTVTINPEINIPPVANAGSDISITLPTSSAMLTGSGYDPDGTIATYVWTKISGPVGSVLNNTNAASTGLNGLTQGVYVYKLTVTDNSDATATDNVTITVNAATPPVNQPPTANAGSDITITLPISSTILAGSGFDADGTITTYAWSWVSGPQTYAINNPNSAATGLTNLIQGTYVFRLTVTDNNGATASDVVTVKVNQAINQAPTANAGADITITLPTNTTTLYGSGADPDGTITSYAWSFVTGPAGYTIANASAATTGLYNLNQGVYVLRLTVTDNRGATASDNIMVTVNAALPIANLPPVARTENDITITLPTNSTQLHGNSSSDPDGVIVAYIWTQVSGPSQSTMTNATTSVATVSNLTTGVYIYELKVTDDDGATATKTINVTVNNQQNPKPFINVYPNPATSVLNIQYVDNVNGKFRLQIYDANRKLMRNELIDKTQVSITLTINVSQYKRGVYFVEIIAPDGKSKTTVQFVKM